MILSGDIGGTKTVLGLWSPDGKLLRETVFPGAKYDSLEDIVDEFLVGERVTTACFGVAGPVENRRAKITNLPWVIDAPAMERRYGARIELLNDLQATAYGHLEVHAWDTLQKGTHAGGTIAVIAPGTGLGEALLVPAGDDYRALPSEAGHADLAPNTAEELELWKFLHAKYGHVSNERVLSGNGLGDLYEFVRVRAGAPAFVVDGDRNAAVSMRAIAQTDPLCVRALEMFVEMLGAECGNIALRTLASCVSIGGGIPPKILPALRHKRFTQRFREKGRFSSWMEAVTIRVCLEPRAALYGSARVARRITQNSA